jgi:CheY-like chemotaxis protein
MEHQKPTAEPHAHSASNSTRSSSGHADHRHHERDRDTAAWALRFIEVEPRHQVLIGSLLRLTGPQARSHWVISDHGNPDALVIGLHSEEGRQACEANQQATLSLPALLLGTPEQVRSCAFREPASPLLLSPPLRHQALFQSLDVLAAQCAEWRAARASASVQAAAAVEQPPRLRALVVDDSQTVRAQLSNVIKRIGMLCDAADSAAAALQRLDGAQYDLIVVDVVMPEMDGYKLTREIKRIKAHRNTPVIILTSQSSPFDRARGALAGCDIYLTKPVGVKAFYEAATRALRKSMALDDLSMWLTEPVPARPHDAPGTLTSPLPLDSGLGPLQGPQAHATPGHFGHVVKLQTR